jgi:hypothetical protein
MFCLTGRENWEGEYNCFGLLGGRHFGWWRFVTHGVCNPQIWRQFVTHGGRLVD